jgi:hypothetical protein
MEELLFYNMNMLLYQKAGDSSTPQRHVTNFEIEYQLCDGGISHIDGQDYPIKEGQLLLAKPGMTRNTTGVYHCLAIHFSCRDESLSAKLKGLPTLLTSPYSGRVKKLLTNAYNAQSGSETHTLRLEGILLQIIAEYMDAGQITHNIPLKYQRYAPGIFQTVDYMNKHFPEHITCDQLASQMFISTNFLDHVINSARRSVQFIIISEQYEKIAEEVNTQLERGVTVLAGEGFYSKEKRQVLLILAKRYESRSIFQLIKRLDPQAFVSMSNVEGVFGEGFDTIKK